MKSRFIVLSTLMFAAILQSFNASAGPRVGNGGGAWICKDKTTQNYRWIQLVDLFEARSEFGYAQADTTGLNYWSIIDARVDEVQKNIPELQSILTSSPAQIKAILHMVPDSSSLSRVDDGHIRVHPAPESCQSGYIYYGQLANFTDDGRLLVDGGIWQNLSFHEVDRAALLIHEVIYKSLRDSRGDTNSSRSRQIVGILFSTLDLDSKRAAIHHVLTTPAPSDDNADVILDPFELTCRAAVTTATGVYTPYDFKTAIAGGEAVQTMIGSFRFRVEADSATGLPSRLLIEDTDSNASTSLDRDLIQAVMTKNHEIGITLDNSLNRNSALLSCKIQIFPQN